MPSIMRTLFLLLATALVLFTGCSRKAGTSNQPITPPIRTKFSTADLSKLRWIEGTWRGTGDVETAFYERYRFENDSTLVVETFDNDKIDKVTDSTRFELTDGQFGNGGIDSRWAATTIDNDSITFEPVTKARNSFRWKRDSKDLWIATLIWPAVENKPARQRVYKMERWPLSK